MTAEETIRAAQKILQSIDCNELEDCTVAALEAAIMVLGAYKWADENPAPEKIRAITVREYVSPEEVREGETFFEPAEDTVCRKLMDQARKQGCIALYRIPMESSGYYLGGKLLVVEQ